MKKVTKKLPVLALCIATFMLSVVPAFAATPAENDGVVSTVQFGNQNLYLDKGSSNNAIALAKSDSSSQNFSFEYDLDKMAYKIHSADDSSLIVAWNAESTNSVFFTNDSDSNENYWVLEEEPSSNKCYLRNYAKGNDGYLTTANSQSGTGVVVSAKTNTGITVSPSLMNDQSLGNNTYRITSVSDPDKVLNRDISLNISVHSGDTASRQKWIFEYSPEKDAYKIKNIDDDGLLTAMAWNSNVDDNVYSYEDLSNDDQYWRLEAVGNGNYVIKNYKNPNKVLELGSELALQGKSRDVFLRDRTNAANQQFKLTVI